MKSLFYGIILIMACGSVCEAQVYGEIRPIVPYVYYGVPYYYTPQTVMVPVAPPQPVIQYVPVTTYQNVLVEKKEWCLLKKYEIVPLYQTVYIPVKY
jgi:hypothetical protein